MKRSFESSMNENVTRRRFLQTSLAAASLAAVSCGRPEAQSKTDERSAMNAASINEANPSPDEMKIAILLYDRMTALDAVGPYEILSRMDGARVYFVGETKGLKTADTKMLALHADYALDEVPRPDILLIPGGTPTDVMKSEKVLDWIRAAHEMTKLTTSVCTGALILGAAGLLKGLPATTHWAVKDALEKQGARYVAERWVETGKIITGAGVSAGIDTALFLVEKLKGRAVAEMIQLSVEYDPQPLTDSGSLKKAQPPTVEAANRFFAARRQKNAG